MKKIYKEELQKLMPIFKAMAEGRTIQIKNGNGWEDIDGDEEGLYLDTLIATPQSYRIKPEPKYYPFKDAEECWAEMQKHQPFGWVNYNGHRVNIAAVMGATVVFTNNKGIKFTFEHIFKECTFADGAPFGIKEEE